MVNGFKITGCVRPPGPDQDGSDQEKRQKQVTFDINQEMQTQLEKLGEYHSNITGINYIHC